MITVFDGACLRLARVFSGPALEEVAEKLGKTRQYRHQLEIDIEPFKGLLLGLFFISERPLWDFI